MSSNVVHDLFLTLLPLERFLDQFIVMFNFGKFSTERKSIFAFSPRNERYLVRASYCFGFHQSE